MMKWIVGLLLLANLALFGWMRWGSMLTVDADAVTVQAPLNADKIKLLASQPVSASAPVAASGVPLTLLPPAVASAPAAATSAPVASTPVAAAPPPAPPKAPSCAEWGEFSGRRSATRTTGAGRPEAGRQADAAQRGTGSRLLGIHPADEETCAGREERSRN